MANRVDRYFKLSREGYETAAPIELILDVAFVLAFSECTADGAPAQPVSRRQGTTTALPVTVPARRSA